jgi:EmrB/QacA subfamily drug resistance transporter
MSETLASGGDVTTDKALDPRRWWVMAVISLATLMVVLDATIVNVALPQAQASLHISNANRQWMVTAYLLPFGGLLLLGGRIADFHGRRRAFLIGLIGFAAASALGGAAPTQGVLFAARGVQGAFAALLAPASLALLNVAFNDKRERTIAFGVYGAVLGGGSAIGLLAGGVLTSSLNWRWCLYVNVAFAAVAFLGGLPLLRESRFEGNRSYDIPGAILVTGGLAAIVYGCAEAAADGWGSGKSFGPLVGGVVLVLAFLVVQTRGRNPLLPMRVVLDRNRGGAYLAAFLIFLAMMGMFLFLTYYLQDVLGYSPLKTGLAILPLTLVIMVGSGIVTGLMRVVPPKLIIAVSFFVCAGALVWFSRIGVQNHYLQDILGPSLMVGLGMSGILVPTTNLSLLGVSQGDSGIASGLLNAGQQVGGSIGVAVLNTVAINSTTNYLHSHIFASQGLAMAEGAVHGYAVGFLVSAAIFAAGGLSSLVLINASAEATAGSGMASADSSPHHRAGDVLLPPHR